MALGRPLVAQFSSVCALGFVASGWETQPFPHLYAHLTVLGPNIAGLTGGVNRGAGGEQPFSSGMGWEGAQVPASLVISSCFAIQVSTCGSVAENLRK